MALASLEDVQVHLPSDKLSLTGAENEYQLAQIDTERVIKGALSSQFLLSTLALWADSSSTPVYIRAIAGRLTASFYYRLRYAEDVADSGVDGEASYAQFKYDEAMRMLQAVIDGTVILEEVQEVEVNVSDLRFYPDADAPGPYITIDKNFF
jgi:hypothetical protein